MRFYTKNGRFAFLSLGQRTMFILGSLESACGLPISVNLSFLLDVTADALRTNIDWKSEFSLKLGQLDPKFQGKGVAPTNHSSCPKTRINDLSCGVRAQDFRLVTNHAFDKQTYRRTDVLTAFSCDRPAFNAARWHYSPA